MRARLLLLFGAAVLMTVTMSSNVAEAASITVNDTSDRGSATTCSLRGAIIAANNDGPVDGCPAGSGADTIHVPAGVYTLTLGAELRITTDLSLIGAGPEATIIQAATAPGSATHRVLRADRFTTVAISGVTIRHGDAAGNLGGSGGGITTNGALSLTNVHVSQNNAPIFGGGIFTESESTLTIVDSTISDNTAGVNAGGIWARTGLELTNSTVANNTATEGGGIYTRGPTTIRGSTVSGNSATTAAGVYVKDTVTVVNSTVSGNTAANSGGGFYTQTGGTLVLTNTTITNNHANSGGGIFRASGTLGPFVNSIIAGNTAGSSRPDCEGSPSSLGHNIIGIADGCGFTPVAGDIVGTASSPIDPKLGPLEDNGGLTATHALLPRVSPAFDAGDDAMAPATDQRGLARPQGAASDISAFELEVETPPPPLPIPSATRWGLIVLVLALAVVMLRRVPVRPRAAG